MSEWWKENNLKGFIEEFETPNDGCNYEPYPFLEHLHAEESYLHFGVRKYVCDLYKDYNNTGHYALFQQTDDDDLLEEPKTSKKTPTGTEATAFEKALDAAKMAAEDRDKKIQAAKTAKAKEVAATKVCAVFRHLLARNLYSQEAARKKAEKGPDATNKPAKRSLTKNKNQSHEGDDVAMAEENRPTQPTTRSGHKVIAKVRTSL